MPAVAWRWSAPLGAPDPSRDRDSDIQPREEWCTLNYSRLGRSWNERDNVHSIALDEGAGVHVLVQDVDDALALDLSFVLATSFTHLPSINARHWASAGLS